ncbi:MAG: family 43 glycosylhydrolase, partial [Clostridia bacterium]|nr:family 43 glycosylhydrolase [Clostridia bacterium]
MKKMFFRAFLTLFIALAVFSIGACAADVVYLKDGGNGDGSTPENALGDMADAFMALPYGGTIVVAGDYTFANSTNYDAALPGFTSPAADGTVTVTGIYGGKDYGARLICASGSRYVCTANTTFENITFYNGSNKTFVVSGRFFDLTFGKGCKMESIEVHVIGGLDHTNGVISVPDDDYSKDSHVTVLGGTIAELTGLGRNVGKNAMANYTGTAYITIGGEGVVNKLFGAYRWGSKTVTGGAVDITFDGGYVTNFMTGCGSEEVAYNIDVTVHITENMNPDNYFTSGTPGWRDDNAFIGLNAGALYRSGTNYGHCVLDLAKAPHITKAWVDSYVCTENFDIITKYKEGASNMSIVYISDMGSDENDGSSFSKPVQSISRAFKLLGKSGGTIVVCGEVKIDTATEAAFPTYENVTITSVCEGIDYRETGASIAFNVDTFLGGNTYIDDIDISNTNGVDFFCQGNSLHIGKNVTTKHSQNPIAIWGGTDCARSGTTIHNTKFFDYTIQIDSGDWHYVRGGSIRTGEAQAVGTIGNVTIIINGGRITNTTTSPTMNGIIAVGGFDALEGDANIIINGGEINCSVMGLGRPGTNSTASNSAYARGDINITITGGTFRSGITVGAIHDVVAGELDGDFTLAVSGGNFAKGFKGFNAESVLGNATVITNGELGFNEVDFDRSVHAQSYDSFEKELASIRKNENDSVVFPTVSVSNNVIYICDKGNGDGSTPANALGDIVLASEKLKNGGVIVVCGKLTVESGKTLRKADGKITLTSTYGGVDYAALNNAHIELIKYISFNSETLIENIRFVSKGNDCYISAEGNEFTVGDGVVCEIFKGNRTEDYPDLIAGSFALSNSIKKDIHMTVKSGTWGSLVGGQFSIVANSGKTRRVEGNIVLDIYGGKFTDDCYIAGINNLVGNATLNAYGGTFACSVFAMAGEAITVNGDVTLSGYSAGFEGDIRASKNSSPTLNGKFIFNVDGADITRASVIVGAEEIPGNNSSEINISESIDLAAPLSGEITFTNPIAGFADPSIVYHEGYYYYTYANGYNGGHGLWMAKAANLCDIGKVEPILIWSQKLTGQGKEMTALWAPQLYFMDGRWYIYAAAQTSKDAATGQDLRY